MPKKPASLPPLQSAELEHERLNSLIGSMADGVLAVDSRIEVVMYNGAALNILDLNGSIKGHHLRRVLKLFDKNNQAVDIEYMVHETKIPTTNRDLLLHYADGSTANLYLSVAPVHLGYGASGDQGYVLLLRDITREKSLEEERDEFISVVSHELRTPMAIAEGNISNARYIAEHTGDMDQIREALAAAYQQIIFLSGLVNDLSTLSRAERDTLRIDVEPINAHKLVQELAENYKKEANEKGLQLYTDIDPHLEALHSSTLYAREILQNFVTNALKYTEHGSVTVGAKAAPKGVTFSVADTGIGISKADQEKVFDKFFRSEDYRTRGTNGTGLGLYVTMKLARLLHAEISVESELDHGSTFTIFVPNLK